MRKLFRVLCLLAILCVAGLALLRLHDGEKPAMKEMESGADELVEQVKDMYEEYGAAAVAQADEKLSGVVKQADEKLEDVVEQADEAIGEAVESAVEGAKEGFLESIKESINKFVQNLTS